jgi:hypothetical protein
VDICNWSFPDAANDPVGNDAEIPQLLRINQRSDSGLQHDLAEMRAALHVAQRLRKF